MFSSDIAKVMGNNAAKDEETQLFWVLEKSANQ